MRFRRFLPLLLPLLPPAAAAPAHGSSSSSSRILMASQGHLVVASLPRPGAGPPAVVLRQALAGDPSWVAFRAPGTVFAVDENGSDVRVLTLDLDAGSASPPPRAFAGSAGVVHLALSRDGRCMLAAAYGAALRLLRTVPADAAPGPRKPRQDRPHPHQTVPDPSGRFFAVPDLGTDRIYLLDAAADAFAVFNRVPVGPPGCGPRHGAFYPPPAPGAGSQRATHFIVLCELANLIHVYELDYDAAGPRGIDFRPVFNISSFAPGAAPPAEAAAGELALGPDGRDVYVSNRLTADASDHIAHFRVKRPGCPDHHLALEFAGPEPCRGKNPRMFSLTADGGSHLLVANQQGPVSIWAMARDKLTGGLAPEPLWNISSSEFGETGPKYVQQIR